MAAKIAVESREELEGGSVSVADLLLLLGSLLIISSKFGSRTIVAKV